MRTFPVLLVLSGPSHHRGWRVRRFRLGPVSVRFLCAVGLQGKAGPVASRACPSLRETVEGRQAGPAIPNMLSEDRGAQDKQKDGCNQFPLGFSEKQLHATGN